MYLENLTLRNFRSFADGQIKLCRDLTIFVGENNGGKSNAIDAIRLLTAPLSGRRDLFCESSDIRFGTSNRRFEIEATFTALKPAQQGRLLSAAADSSLERAVFGLVYDETGGGFPVRPTIWAGQAKAVPEPGSQHMVRHVYLPPLRDAKRALASGNPTRIHALLQHFLGDNEPDDLARLLGRNQSHEILSKVDSAVEVGLLALTGGVRRQNAAMGFSTDERLIDIARDLRFKLADHGVIPEDLRFSGHGYANLLYLATIAVELDKVDNADLTIFLVEEPEAHLHPQLQAAVLGFLEDQAARSREGDDKGDGPAGEVQVVVATHSPNLSAWVAGKNVVVFRAVPDTQAQQPPPAEPDDSNQSDGTVENVRDHIPTEPSGQLNSEQPPGLPTDGSATAGARRTTRCMPLSDLQLDPDAWRKIDRYLDVTKCALLFGGRVLLVEGIAEALLLPVIAKRHILAGRSEDLRRFRSAVFVPIEGVDFEPYVRLLLTSTANVRIADRVVVLTDGDSGECRKDESSPGSNRKRHLEAVAEGLGASDVISVVTNSYTLEPELVNAGNGDLLKRAYLHLHPRLEAKWNAAAFEGDEGARALAFKSLFGSVRKGDFAQVLAGWIDDGEAFTTPSYLSAAIEALVR